MDTDKDTETTHWAFSAQAFVVDKPWGDGDWVVLGSPDPHQALVVADCSMIDDTQGDELPYTNAEAAAELARRWNELAALRAALGGLLDATDAHFCQGEDYIAEDEQAECMRCSWCRARVALGRPEANAVAVGTPSHEDVLRELRAASSEQIVHLVDAEPIGNIGPEALALLRDRVAASSEQEASDHA